MSNRYNKENQYGSGNAQISRCRYKCIGRGECSADVRKEAERHGGMGHSCFFARK